MTFKKGEIPKGAKPFKKGKDPRRNINGQPKKLPELDKILDNVLGEIIGDTTAMESVIKALYDKASKGDTRAAEILLNRAYGMAKQSIDHTTDGEKLPAPTINILPKTE